jgi:two-component system sensor histidine kinase PhoQ
VTGGASGPTYSLRRRLLAVASAVLAAFLGLTGLTLDRAFRDSARVAVDERLRAAVFMLLSAANTTRDGRLAVPAALPDPRLATPESGFYARVVDSRNQTLWRSPSMVGLEVPFPPPGDVGSAQAAELVDADGRRYFGLSYVVAWEREQERVESFVFQAAESRASFKLHVTQYRRALWGWLIALGAGLVAAQAVVLRWALAPLAQVSAELRDIESGSSAEITGRYPGELHALTTNLNDLIRSSSAHLTRYRNALADLAHSLKTPLAVVRAALSDDSDTQAFRQLVREQVERIDQTVDYQLQRAAASGRTALSAPVAVRGVADRLTASLAKVYAAKSLEFSVDVDERLTFSGDEGDLLEVLGNVLDNACKWARRSVAVHARRIDARIGEHGEIALEIDDDGPGFPSAHFDAQLGRGVRADPSTAGHGIGLAVVRDIVQDVYRGRLELGVSGGGGARVRLVLPGR